MVEVVLDSDVLIDWLRGDPKTGQVLERLIAKPFQYSFYITSITDFELLVGGFKTGTQTLVQSKIATFDTLNFDSRAAEIAARLFAELTVRGKTPPLKDLFIAAICISFDLPLATRNKRDFEQFKELRILDLA